ncbi:hypothetical protein DFJ74DRAFT_662952 [Hyaloraphidium curvatum]|nr:hypothetical protein DFJ74DRAFT_662952 [Hyaloraphidium curvatum]
MAPNTGKELSWIFVITVLPGKRDELLKVMDDMVASTKGEEGCLEYLWFENAEKTEVQVLERYKDAEAGLVHSANFGKFAERLFAASTYKEMTVWGNLEGDAESAEGKLKAGLATMNARFYGPFGAGGFTK